MKREVRFRLQIIFLNFLFFFSFCYLQAYASLCFSLMYETESDEKHLDFIATNQPMVSHCFPMKKVFFSSPAAFSLKATSTSF